MKGAYKMRDNNNNLRARNGRGNIVLLPNQSKGLGNVKTVALSVLLLAGYVLAGWEWTL
jgi:hypothetical protein